MTIDLLEYQVSTRYIINPTMNARMTMDEAVQNRLEEPKLHEKLKKRMQQVTKFPYSKISFHSRL